MMARVQVPQDLHIHTVFSAADSAVVPQQTPELVAAIGHARVLGISDHFEFAIEGGWEEYARRVRDLDLYLGVEVSSSRWVAEATGAGIDVDYYIYHCADSPAEYRGAEKLLESSKPVIIAHPMMMGTDLGRVPPTCLVEVNNRYAWQYDWRRQLGPFAGRFRWVVSSDAHQPGWLNQNLARYVAVELGIEETLLFPDNFAADR
jgi:hypothetical protein